MAALAAMVGDVETTAVNIPPHLGKLHRDRLGRPVPYINIWSSEKPEAADWRMTYDPLVDGVAVSTAGAPGQGEPDFFHQHPKRQRRCAVMMLCQVCATPLEYGTALLPIGALSAETVTIQDYGATATVFNEPWICEPCADFASKICPGLIRRRRADEVEFIRPTDSLIIVSRAWIESALGNRRLERISKQVQPVLWAKIAVRT
jgi:hypothetical protein